MVEKINNKLKPLVDLEYTYFRYTEKGWIFSNSNDCNVAESYNPHIEKIPSKDGAAHSRAICCIKFFKQ